MIDPLLTGVVRNRILVLSLTLVVAAFGVFNLVKLPIDAVPDITNKQVQINTVAPSLGPLDIEKRVTFPIETALAGMPVLESTRSLSRNGFSQVTAVFKENTDIYFARQLVAERLNQARATLPAETDPQMGAISTGLGEVLSWGVEFAHPGGRGATVRSGEPGWQSDGSYITPEGQRLADSVSQAGYLRTVQDWIIAPQLKTVNGVAGVDAIGGYEKQYVVSPDPGKLAAYGISYFELAQALEAANLSVGADFVTRNGEAFLVRADARIRTIEQIAGAAVATRGGVAVRVRDVAAVSIGGGLRTGAASINGREAVVGTVQMLTGANSRTVAKSAGDKLKQVSLPPDAKVTIVYDRAKLVNATITTVEKNLMEGALLVIVSLFLLLGNVRAAIITALVIPFSMLITAIGMNVLGVSGNLMSLGALDFGLIVDGSVIIIENCLRRMAERQEYLGRVLDDRERRGEVVGATLEMVRPSLFGQAIILLVFAPLLTFQGVEGKMFSPMAITVMLALAGAFVLSLTFVPAMVALLMRGRVAENEVRLIARPKVRYAKALRWTLTRPWPVIGGGVAVFAVSLVVFMSLGREFIPQLDEIDISIEGPRIPSMALDQAIRLQTQAERAIAQEPEVAVVYSKIGTGEAATDPMPQSFSDTFIILKPKDTWPDPHISKDALIAKLDKRLDPLVGSVFEFTQPIQMRFNELIAGVRGDVAVKIYGENLDTMGAAAAQVARILSTVRGAQGVRAEQTVGSPTFDVQFDRETIARLGLTMQEVADTVAVALGGRASGQVFEGDQRFDVVVRAADATRNDLDAIGALPVMLPAQGSAPRASVPLRQLVHFAYTDGLNQVSRENGRRRVVVQVNVRGRDLGSFVAEAQKKVEGKVKLPPGGSIEWGGQFENLKAASARISLVVPITAVLIFGLLYMALGTVRAAVSVFSAVPMAVAGGVFSLALTGLPFSISAAVGFMALSGVAVLNGLVMMSSILKRLADGLALDDAIMDGAIERFRSVVMTAIVPSLGFVPMAIATGTGAEVQKPLAIVVIGGLMTATALTLFVLPAISSLLLRGVRPTPATEGAPT